LKGDRKSGRNTPEIFAKRIFDEQITLAVEGERLWGSYLAAAISKRFPDDPITLF